jgi:hypothetical protein
MIKPRRLLSIPSLGDRVVIAAGEDAATGSKKMAELLEQVAKDLAPGLTPNETATLSDYYAGRRFKRRQGEYKGTRRIDQIGRRLSLLLSLRKLRDYVRNDPAEKKKKSASGYDLNRYTAERARELLLQPKAKRQREWGDDFVDTRTPSVVALRKLLRNG